MGHRHFPNSSNMPGINQGFDNNLQSHQSYHLTGGVHSAQRNPLDRVNEFAFSNFQREVNSLPSPYPGHSYYPFSNSAGTGNLHVHPCPVRNASTMNPSYYNSQNMHDFGGVLPDPLGGCGRGSYKRKHPWQPTFDGPLGRGCTSRSDGVGSSSGYSQLLIGKLPSSYEDVSFGPFGLNQHRGSGHVVTGEDTFRNVRSRSTLDVEPLNARRNFSSYPSQHYDPATFQTYSAERMNLSSSNADLGRQELKHRPFPSVAPGRGSMPVDNGISLGMNHFVGRGASNVSDGHHDYLLSRHPVSSSQIYNGASAQAARECSNFHSRRGILRNNCVSYSSVGHEAMTLDVMRSHLGISSRNTGSISTGGLHSSYRSVRSSLALETLQPVSSLVDPGPGFSTEVTMIMDHASFYTASRSSSDQYRDMRLDIDSMSYEELLTLEETIGSVSTGLSEDVILKCLSKKRCYSGGQNCMDGSCAICLEKYKTDDEIGTLKNCGHDYHIYCITKWLLVKNVCPICKAAALTESLNH